MYGVAQIPTQAAEDTPTFGSLSNWRCVRTPIPTSLNNTLSAAETAMRTAPAITMRSALGGHTGRRSNDVVGGRHSVLVSAAEDPCLMASPLHGLCDNNLAVSPAPRCLQSSRCDDRNECEDSPHNGITASARVATVTPTTRRISLEEEVYFDGKTMTEVSSQTGVPRAGGEYRATVHLGQPRRFDDHPTGMPPRGYLAVDVTFRIPRGLFGSRLGVEEPVLRDRHNRCSVVAAEVNNASCEDASDGAGHHLPPRPCDSRGDADSSTSPSAISESSLAVILSSPANDAEIEITRLTSNAIPTRQSSLLLVPGGAPATSRDGTTVVLSEDYKLEKHDDNHVPSAASSRRSEVGAGRRWPSDPVIPDYDKILHGTNVGICEDVCGNEAEELGSGGEKRGLLFPATKDGSVDGNQEVKGAGECRDVVEWTRSAAATGIDKKDVRENNRGVTTPPRLKRVKETCNSGTLLEINHPLVGSLLYNTDSLRRKRQQEALRLGGAVAEIPLDEKNKHTAMFTVTRLRETQRTQPSQRQTLPESCSIPLLKHGTTTKLSSPTNDSKLVATTLGVDGDDKLKTPSACQSKQFLVAATLATGATSQPCPAVDKAPYDTSIEDTIEGSRCTGVSAFRVDVKAAARPPLAFVSERSDVEMPLAPPLETTLDAREAVARITGVDVGQALVPAVNETIPPPPILLPAPLSNNGKSFDSHRSLNVTSRALVSSARASSPLGSSATSAKSTLTMSCSELDKGAPLLVSSESLGMGSAYTCTPIPATGNPTQTHSPQHGHLTVPVEATINGDDCTPVRGTKRPDSLDSCANRAVKRGAEARQTAPGERGRGRRGSAASGDIAVSVCRRALETKMATPADQGQLDPGGNIASINSETTTMRRDESDNSSRVVAAYIHDAGANIAYPEGTVVPSSEEYTDKVIDAHRPRWGGNLPVPERDGGDAGRVLAHVGHGGKIPIHATPLANGNPPPPFVCAASCGTKRISDSPPPLSLKQSAWVQPSQHSDLSEVIVCDKACDTIPTTVPLSAIGMPTAILEQRKSHSTRVLLDGLPGSSRSYTPTRTTLPPSALFRPPKKVTVTEDLGNCESRSMESSVCNVPPDEDRGHLQSPPRLAAGRWWERLERWKALRPRLDASGDEAMAGHPDSEKHT